MKSSAAQRNLIKASEEIKVLKSKIEENKEAHKKVKEEIDILQKVGFDFDHNHH